VSGFNRLTASLGLRHVFFAALLLAEAVLIACSSTPTTATTTRAERTPQESAMTYLASLSLITNGNPTQQADLFYEAERDFTNAPTTANTMRFALILVAPSHPGSDPVRGKKMLEQLLATPERLTPNERNIASFLVKDAEIRLQLETENRRLTATVDERSKGQANFDRRTQVLADENARLRKQLDEAQRKLDAIKSIEINTRERSIQPLPVPSTGAGTRDGSNQPNSTQSSPSGR
jgi:hypothetical protein